MTPPSPPVVLVLMVDPHAADHLASVLDGHARWCRSKGYAPTRMVANSGQAQSMNGHGWPTGDSSGPAGDDDLVLLTYEQVARRLGGMSERTVRRLVSDGQLRAVNVGAKRRVHRDDLTEFAEQLRRTESRPAGI